MDLTETYIKMCEKAEEIQSQASFSPDDFVYNSGHDRVIVAGYHDEDGEWLRGKNPIWLPRQDQLQEMVHPEVTDWVKAVMLRDFLKDYCDDGASMEQLWLAFVMKEKYGKIWDGENWIEGGDKCL